MENGPPVLPPSGVQLLEDEDVVWSRVWPLVSGGASPRRGATFAVSVPRRRDDGRAVAEYDFDGLRVFAKLYPDEAEAERVYRIHARLCEHGFGEGSRFRVPEPLGRLDGLLVVRAAAGENLGVTLRRDWSAFEEGVVRAADWLASLHNSAIDVGPREDRADGLARLARRAETAATMRPELEHTLRSALAELRGRAASAASTTVVQTHGRYHGGHVFMRAEDVTAIDVDRAALADPAKDVGEFVASLSSIRTLGLVDDHQVDGVIELFLGEYARHRPGVPHELAYYWSYCVVWALVRRAFKDRPGRRGWQRRLEHLRAELDAVPRRVAASPP